MDHFSGGTPGGLWDYLQQMFSVLVPPLVVLFLGGALWPRGTASAAFSTLLIGHGLGLALFILGQLGLWPLHYTINVFIMTVMSAVAFVTLSLMDDRQEPDPETIWTRDKALDTEAGFDGALWQDIRLHALLLIMAMLGVLWLFW